MGVVRCGEQESPYTFQGLNLLHAEVSTASGLIAAENELGQLLLLNLSSLEKRDKLIFNSPIAMKHFSDDGKRLFVLTAAQTVYVLDVSALAGSSATKAAAN